VSRRLVLAAVFALGWLGGYWNGVYVGERDRSDRDP
jgi:hypothetical protein